MALIHPFFFEEKMMIMKRAVWVLKSSQMTAQKLDLN